jgi:hypothetical protein
MPFPSLDLDIALDVMSGVVALLVSSYAYRYNKLLANSTLKFIGVGFIMLGVGLLIEAWAYSFVIFGVGDLSTDRAFAIVTSAMYELLQMGAFFVLALGYLRSAFSSQKRRSLDATALAGIALPIVTSTGPGRLRDMLHFAREIWVVAEILSIVFLAVVVLVGFLGYSETRHRFSLLVILSFILILAAQAFDLWTVVSISVRLDFLSSIVQFGGFLTLLVFIIWRGRIGSAREATQ